MSTANIELVNPAVDPVFNNTIEDDLAFYTENSNQAMHFGTMTGGVAPSMMKLTRSNMEINGDIVLTKKVNVNGLAIYKRSSVGAPQNITSVVSNVQGLASTASNMTFSLSNGQSEFRFVNSNNQTMASVAGTGTSLSAPIYQAPTDTVAMPAYSWQGDTNTGVYHAASGQVGIACSGSNTLTITPATTTMNSLYWKAPNIPKFRATLAANTAITNEINPLVLTNIQFDHGNNYVAGTTGRFTAPVAGIYMINAAASTLTGNNGILGVLVYVNGTLYAQSYQMAGGNVSSSMVTTMVSLAAGGYVHMSATNSGTANNLSAAMTYLEGYLIG